MNVLVIKLGASGDVIRTTSLLHVLHGNIFWISAKYNLELLNNSRIIEKYSIEEKEIIQKLSIDKVLSLDDEFEAACIATFFKKKGAKVVGAYLDDDGKVIYSEDSAEWFDMGILSKYGIDKANELKKKNICTYQEILFRICGYEFTGEEYFLERSGKLFNCDTIVGIERRCGNRWPTKKWNNFDELIRLLKEHNIKVYEFEQKPSLKEYIHEIDKVDILVTGDTLALHIGLGLGKKTICIFTCTSPTEIYGYERLTKIVSPLLEKAYYKKEYLEEVVNAIPVNEVFRAVMEDVGLLNNRKKGKLN